MSPAPRSFDRTATSDQVLEGLDLSGGVALVTGASSGLGAETARALAARGARVVMTARDGAKAERIAESIRSATGSRAIEVAELHLEQPASVRAFALHPGGIVTELGRHLGPEDLAVIRARAAERAPGGKAFWKTVEQGAATQLFAATAPELDGRGGLYLEDVQVSGLEPCPLGVGCSPWALDPEAAERLWALSEATLGERFGLA